MSDGGEAGDKSVRRKSKPRIIDVAKDIALWERPIGALGALLRDLPKLRASAESVDFAGSSQAIVHSVLENAETTVCTINRGVAAIGILIAHCSPEIDDGSIQQDTIESLGWALAEMGELASVCTVLAARCRFSHPPLPKDNSPAWFRAALAKAHLATAASSLTSP